MRRRGPIRWAEVLPLALPAAALVATTCAVIDAYQRAGRSRLAPAAQAVALAIPPRKVDAPAPPPSAIPPVPRPDPPSEPSQPPPDPTAPIVADLAAKTRAARDQAADADRRAASLLAAARTAETEAARWMRRETVVRSQLGALEHQADQAEVDAETMAIERDVLLRERDAKKAALVEAKRRASSWAVLPVRAANGTWRRPIILECVNGAVQIMPDGPKFGLLDVSSPLGLRGSPYLASVVREVMRVRAAGSPDNAPVVPYFFFVVRPDGILPYYAARTRLEPLGLSFGYELVDQDMPIDYPSLDDASLWGDGKPDDAVAQWAAGRGAGRPEPGKPRDAADAYVWRGESGGIPSNRNGGRVDLGGATMGLDGRPHPAPFSTGAAAGGVGPNGGGLGVGDASGGGTDNAGDLARTPLVVPDELRRQSRGLLNGGGGFDAHGPGGGGLGTRGMIGGTTERGSGNAADDGDDASGSAELQALTADAAGSSAATGSNAGLVPLDPDALPMLEGTPGAVGSSTGRRGGGSSGGPRGFGATGTRGRGFGAVGATSNGSRTAGAMGAGGGSSNSARGLGADGATSEPTLTPPGADALTPLDPEAARPISPDDVAFDPAGSGRSGTPRDPSDIPYPTPVPGGSSAPRDPADIPYLGDAAGGSDTGGMPGGVATGSAGGTSGSRASASQAASGSTSSNASGTSGSATQPSSGAPTSGAAGSSDLSQTPPSGSPPSNPTLPFGLKPDTGGQMGEPPNRRDPPQIDPAKNVSVTLDLVLACRRDGVEIEPGGYRTSLAALSRRDGLLLRQLEAIVLKYRRLDPELKIRPRVRFLVEPGGGTAFASAREQILINKPEWPSTTRYADDAPVHLLEVDR